MRAREQMVPPLRRLRRWLGTHPGTVAVLLALAALGLWIFGEVLDEVIEGETAMLDRRLLMALRNPGDPTDPLGPAWVEEMARDVTALGGVAVLAFVTLASAGLTWLQGRRATAGFILLSVGSGLALSSLAKALIDRPRPDLVPHGSHVYTASFPSGHSMMAAVTWLTLALILARGFPRKSLKLYVVSLAVVVTLAVGISRVYLGVHWPTDVLAGWAAGASWALACAALATALTRRGTIEPPARGARD